MFRLGGLLCGGVGGAGSALEFSAVGGETIFVVVSISDALAVGITVGCGGIAGGITGGTVAAPMIPMVLAGTSGGCIGTIPAGTDATPGTMPTDCASGI